MAGGQNLNIESLKEKLSDEEYSSLETHVKDLIGQRDTARKESIDGRKTLKSDLEKQRSLAAKALERLGVSTEEELDDLPDLKGQADANKQLESKVKRLEGEIAREKERNQQLEKASKDLKKSEAIQKAISAYPFLDADVVAAFVERAVEFDGDELVFKTETGSIVSVGDGVAALAAKKPALLKSSGAGGSGHEGGAGGSGKEANPYAKETFNLTKQGEIETSDPQKAQQLKAAASNSR